MALAFASGSVAMDRGSTAYNSGKRPQAGGFSPINRARGTPVKGSAKSLFLKVTFDVFERSGHGSREEGASQPESAGFSGRGAAPARQTLRIRPPARRSRPGT